MTQRGVATETTGLRARLARRPFWLFLLLSLLLILPALLLSNPFGTDGPVHIRWQAYYARAFWGGQPWIRWLPEMNEGFGSPAFLFYPPLLQMMGTLLAPLLPGDGEAIRRLALTLALLGAVSAQACRQWLLALGASPRGAMLAGIFWLLMPYRAFVDTYQRAALAECASLAVLPLAALAAVRLIDGRRFGWSLHALSVALLAHVHLPGMVIGYLFLGAHGLALVVGQPAGSRWRALRDLGTSALIGLLLAGAMLVPALGLLDQIVDPSAMSGERNQPHNWLLFSPRPWIDPVTRLMTIGVLAMTLMLAFGFIWPARLTGMARGRAVAGAMLMVVVAVALLNTQWLHALWDLPTPLRRIQFPFRLLGLSSLAVCVLAGLAHDHVGRWQRGLWLLLALVFLGDCGVLAYQRLRPRDIHPLTVTQVMQSSMDSSEYVLGDIGPAMRRFGSQQALVLNAQYQPVDHGLAQVISVTPGNRRMLVDYTARASTTIVLRQFAFSGWECRIDGAGWFAAGIVTFEDAGRVSGSPTARLPVCAVPPGPHRLEARMPLSQPERTGIGLGLAGLAILVLTAGWALRRP